MCNFKHCRKTILLFFVIFLQLQSINAQVNFPPNAKVIQTYLNDSVHTLKYLNSYTLMEYTVKYSLLNGSFTERYIGEKGDTITLTGKYLNNLKTGKWIKNRRHILFNINEEYFYENDTLQGIYNLQVINKKDASKNVKYANNYIKGEIYQKISGNFNEYNDVEIEINYFNNFNAKKYDSTLIISQNHFPIKVLKIYTDTFTENYNKEFTGKVYGWYSNNNLAYSEKFIQNKLIDTAIYYHQNKQIKELKIYNEKGLNGLIKSWYDNGNIHEERFCQNGLIDSFGRVFWPNGKLKKEAEILLNRIYGNYKEYDENGNLILVQKHSEKWDGTFKEWNGNGNLLKYTVLAGSKNLPYQLVYFDDSLNNSIYYEFSPYSENAIWYFPNGVKAKQTNKNGTTYWAPTEKIISDKEFLKNYSSLIPEKEPLMPRWPATKMFETSWEDSSVYVINNYSNLEIAPQYIGDTIDIINILNGNKEIKNALEKTKKSEINVIFTISDIGRVLKAVSNISDNENVTKIELNNNFQALKFSPAMHRDKAVNGAIISMQLNLKEL